MISTNRARDMVRIRLEFASAYDKVSEEIIGLDTDKFEMIFLEAKEQVDNVREECKKKLPEYVSQGIRGYDIQLFNAMRQKYKPDNKSWDDMILEEVHREIKTRRQ